MKNNSRYEYYLDLSGTLPSKNEEDVFLGCILMSENFKTSFLDKFYREFPSLKPFKKKGSSLRPEKLIKIMEYLSSLNIKMVCVVFKGYVKKKIRRNLIRKISSLKKINPESVSIRKFEERIFGLMYFKALSSYSKENYPYNCYMCPESQLDIQEALSTLKRISYKKFFFKPAYVPRRIEHLIKFADFIASAGRKLDKPIRDTFKNFKYINYEPTDEELNIAFNLSRRENPDQENLLKFFNECRKEKIKPVDRNQYI